LLSSPFHQQKQADVVAHAAAAGDKRAMLAAHLPHHRERTPMPAEFFL